MAFLSCQIKNFVPCSVNKINGLHSSRLQSNHIAPVVFKIDKFVETFWDHFFLWAMMPFVEKLRLFSLEKTLKESALTIV